MVHRSRRQFFADVGKGMVVASVGTGLATDLGFSPAFAEEGAERLTFGPREPLVSLMQETPAAKLLPALVDKIQQGTPLVDLVAAAALANARTFGGEDYVGFHTMMAIAPAYHMSEELSSDRRALPVLKVLYRNAARIQERGGAKNEVLKPVQAAKQVDSAHGGELLRESVRKPDINEAEARFAALTDSADSALNHVLCAVEDGADVHRVVLPYRCWDLMGIIGQDQAHTLLRQSVRFCVKGETPRYVEHMKGVRAIVPKMLDQHKLVGRELGTRTAEDSWVDQLSQTLFNGTPSQAAEAAAAALAEGFSPAAIGEAIALAANQLVLRDNGRANNDAANKPAGSIHGDSIGVHACDSANAWCNLARVSSGRNKAVCLILGAWQVASDRFDRGGDFLKWLPYPREDACEKVGAIERDALLPGLKDAIKNRDQARACALVQRYGELQLPDRPVWDLLLGYSVSEDGALHAEKFYRTSREEFSATRAAFRWRYLIGLARVVASEHGYAAPGYAEACKLLGV